MADNTEIAWADSTFNPWIGCTKVGPGCDNCYAEADFGQRKQRAKWGPGNPRSRTSVANWKKPVQWNAKPFYECPHCGNRSEANMISGLSVGGELMPVCPACHHGPMKPARRRVFCASLADVFDNEVPAEWRADLFALIEATPNLDWLLLTKRIGNVERMIMSALRSMFMQTNREPMMWPWPNVWIGATICNQAEADRDIQKLVAVPATVRFLSMEPLLGAVDIAKWLDPWTCSNCGHHGSYQDTGPDRCSICDVELVDGEHGDGVCPVCGISEAQSDEAGGTCPNCVSVTGWSRDYGYKFDSEKRLIDWVIVGGESGPKARPMHPDWVRSLRDQCREAGVPFLFKQWGEFVPRSSCYHTFEDGRSCADMDPSCERWPNVIRLTESGGDGHRLEHVDGGDDAYMQRVGKKIAGRLIDGVQHDGYPGSAA